MSTLNGNLLTLQQKQRKLDSCGADTISLFLNFVLQILNLQYDSDIWISDTSGQF